MQPETRTWRPQAFGPRKPKELSNPIVEPAWDGVRILAHAGPEGVQLIDAEGVDLAAAHPEIAEELAGVTRDEALVIDGYLTDQALRSGIGVDFDIDQTPGLGEHMTQFFLGQKAADAMAGRGQIPGRATARTVGQAEASAAAAAAEQVPIAFVAVDLLVLDQDDLRDVPLLERKRLLESVLPEGPRVRRTTFVREPAGSFIITWRALGFGGLAYKEANSRYHPGAVNEDWSLIPMPRR